MEKKALVQHEVLKAKQKLICPPEHLRELAGVLLPKLQTVVLIYLFLETKNLVNCFQG